MKATALKKRLSLLLAFVLCLTGVLGVGTTTASAAAQQIEAYLISFPRDGDENLDYSGSWGHGDLQYMNGWYSGSTPYTSVHGIGSFTGQICYCIEPGVPLDNGDVLTAFDESFWENYPSSFNSTIQPYEIRQFIGRILQYGYNGNISTSWRSQNDGADKLAHATATQLLIWETVVGERDSDFNHVSAGGYDAVLDQISESHPLRSRILSYYNSMEASVKSHARIPSFMAKTAGRAQTVELAWNGSEYTAALTDTNGVLGNFSFSSSDAGVRLSVSGNTLTIAAAEAPEDGVTITAEKKNAVRAGFITWSDGKVSQSSATLQDVVTYAESVSDPVTGYLNLKVSYGSLRIVKESEDGAVSGIPFTVSGNGFQEDVVTEDDGKILLENLAPGEYTVTEQTDDRYVPQESRTITVVSGKTTAVEFGNVLKKFTVTLTKADRETGTAQGDARLAEAVYGLYKDGELVDKYTTDENGSFTTAEYICGSDWTIREIMPGEGYLLDETVYEVGAEAGNFTIEHNMIPVNVGEDVIKGKIALLKHMNDGSTQIETPEEGAVFEVYLKSAGSYEAAEESERDILVCDAFGYAESKSLPYGAYTVKQVSGTEGRELLPPFEVFVSEDGEVYRYLINNAMFESLVEIVKKDMETGEVIPVPGVGFKVRNTDTGEYIVQRINYPTPVDIDVYYTDSTGKLLLPEPLPYGNYEVIEQCTAYGYVLDSEPVPFTVDGTQTTVVVEKHNLAQKGTITVGKTGEVFASVSESDGIYQPVYADSGIPDTEYVVRAVGNIVTPDGSLRYADGEIVARLKTGADGTAVTEPLYLGKYAVYEVTAAYGMTVSSEPEIVELTYAGENIAVTSAEVSFYNERQKAEISLYKILEQDEKFGIGMNGEILSVRFGLFAAEELTAADGSIIPADGLLEIGSCSENGRLVFQTDVPVGAKLYVKEIATDNHYLLSDEKYPVEFVYAGQDTAVVEIRANKGEAIKNNLIYGTVKGLKIDRETKESVADALFGLFRPEETEFTAETAILTAKSGEDGVFTFEDVPYGEWLVRELAPAKGFLPGAELYPVTISENEQLIEITAVNDRIPELGTQAAAEGKKEVTAQGSITIEDTVSYKHLIPGEEYTIKGILMDKSTGEPFMAGGKEVTAEVTFIPEQPDGEIRVTFTFDAGGITEVTEIVVFERLYRDGMELAAHADLEDEGQTVKLTPPAPDVPQTGDNSNPGFWIGLGAVALGGLVACVIIHLKKKKGDENE